MNLIIRNMETHETKAVLKLGRQCFVGLEKLLLSKPQNALVALDNDELIGATIYKIIQLNSSIKVAYIEFAFIKKEYQGKGIGNAIYEEVSNLLKKSECTAVIALVADDNVASWKLFKNKGYGSISISKLYSFYGFYGGFKIWYNTMFAWAVGHKMWHTGIINKHNELQDFFLFLFINLIVILPVFFYCKNFTNFIIWISNIYFLIITPLLISKFVTLFFKSKWAFHTIQGGVLTSVVVSIFRGSLPVIGRMYPREYKNTQKLRQELGITAISEWISLLLIVIIFTCLRNNFQYFIVSVSLGKIYLLYHSIPVYPFASFGGKSIWNWNKYLSIVLLIIAVILLFF